MFDPMAMQVGDETWVLSKWAYNRLRAPAVTGGKSMGATARRAVNEFMRLCRAVD
jgi:hypothetical protein